MVDIDTDRRISDIYISQNSSNGYIYGLKLLDQSGKTIIDEQWNKFSALSKFLPDQIEERHY